MKRRSLIKGMLATVPGSRCPFRRRVDDLFALGADKPSRVWKEFPTSSPCCSPAKRRCWSSPSARSVFLWRARRSICRQAMQPRPSRWGKRPGLEAATILPWHNGFAVAVLEKHVTHQGVIAFVTADRELARDPKQIGDLSQIKPRLSGVREVRFKWPEKICSRPDTLGSICFVVR